MRTRPWSSGGEDLSVGSQRTLGRTGLSEAHPQGPFSWRAGVRGQQEQRSSVLVHATRVGGTVLGWAGIAE